MSKGKFLAVCVVWLLIVAALAASYRLLIHPLRQQQILGDTDSDSQYKHRVNLALDSFSGYAILRSSQMKDELAKKRIRLNLIDDGADYKARLRGLRERPISAGRVYDRCATECFRRTGGSSRHDRGHYR